MRKLIEDRIRDLVNDGADLSALEFCPPTTVNDLPNLTDQELLEVLEDIIGFHG